MAGGDWAEVESRGSRVPACARESSPTREEAAQEQQV
jgi:hypothetical protein